MNENMARLLERLETTDVPTVTGTLRTERNGQVCMCPLGHLVDLYIKDTPGARWTGAGRYSDPTVNPGISGGYPSDQALEHFGLDYLSSERIYKQNDRGRKTPREVAQFIREEILGESE